ncbi:MAG: hypothetical protein VB018_13460 [Lachnospiraceae bacterium]|nr:hypothetical protein [Lachnospiraceae bacterium]
MRSALCSAFSISSFKYGLYFAVYGNAFMYSRVVIGLSSVICFIQELFL